jgi:hypothetical protein
MKNFLQMNSSNSKALTQFKVPLTKMAHHYAQEFYQYQANPEKRKKIYLNTLAVYAVNYYLECLEIETDLSASHSWNPVAQILGDTADLMVRNTGKLECCAVWSDSQICEVSTEAVSERIAYVGVWFDPELTQATLLGFAKTVETNKLFIDRLQPLDNLVPYLSRLEADLAVTNDRGVLEKIRDLLSLTWQQVEPLLNPSATENGELAFGYRSSDVVPEIGYLATDLLDLGESTKLSMAAMPRPESTEIDVIVELSGESLPIDLELVAQASTGEKIISAKVEPEDTSICLQFVRNLQEPFTLAVIGENFLYTRDWKYS